MSLFSRPYTFENSARRHVLRASGFGLFVFAFLFIFQPFGLTGSGRAHLFFLLGYGAITSGIMLTLNVLLPLIFRSLFDESRWTTGREITYTTLNILLIAVANYLYTLAMTSFTGGFIELLWFIGVTFLVGLFPTTAVVLLKERRDRKHFSLDSARLSNQLKSASGEAALKADDMISLPSFNRSEDDLTVRRSSLRLLRSADNYVEVFFMEGKTVRKVVLRSTLKEMEEVLSPHPSFFRCHKSYLVNLGAVQRISGNAQGYKLHVNDLDNPVPVSRSYNELIRERLPIRP